MSEAAEALVGRVSHLLQQTPLQSSRTHKDCTRRAAVAVILRLSCYPEQQLSSVAEAVDWCERAKPFVDVFFIKRASNPRDRWSGHIALPGGHQEGEETDEETCVRETREEVGIDLSKDFLCLGRMDERRMQRRKGNLCIVPLVYLHTAKEPPTTQLQQSEVQAAFWVPEQVFQMYVLHNAGPRELAVAMSRYWQWMRYPFVKELVTLLGVDVAYFPAVQLPAPEIAAAEASLREQDEDDHGYVLWGFTFGVISELLMRMGIGRLQKRKDARFRFRGTIATILATWVIVVMGVTKPLKRLPVVIASAVALVACVAALFVFEIPLSN